MTAVNRATLADQAYRALRGRVLAGQLPGGRRLLPEELAVELAISPTPIKEALLRLEADGLVVSPLRKGTVVRQFTERDIEELYEARALIELDAMARVFDRGQAGPAFAATIRATLARHAALAGSTVLDDLVEALGHDRMFHQQIIEASGNRMIADWHRRVLAQTHTVFACRAGNYARSVDEHAAILAAIEAGSREGALEALRHHLGRSRDHTLADARTMPRAAPADA